MGKSFRYNPDDESFEDRGFERRRAKSRWEGPQDGCEAEAAIAACKGFSAPTPEWAIERMKKRVRHVVDVLAFDGIIPRSECEDYVSIFNKHICRVLPFYDPGHVSDDGERSSLVHFLHVAVDNVASNVRKMSRRLKRRHTDCPIVSSEDEREKHGGAVCAEDRCLSDQCRNVRDLWFKMDVKTLFSMLLPEERLCVRMRMEGYSNTEVAEEISIRFEKTVDRLHIERTMLKRIQKAARKCGFFPPSETTAKRPENKMHISGRSGV